MLIALLSIMFMHHKNKKIYEYLVVFSLIISFIPYHIYYLRDTPMFYDLLVIVGTLIVLQISTDAKYTNRIIVLLIGLNMMFTSQRFFEANGFHLIDNILMAIATGILASGLLEIYFDTDKRKSRTKIRKNVLHDFLMIIEEVSKELYRSHCSLNGADDNFHYVKYEKFSEEFQSCCEDVEMMKSLLHDNLLFELKELYKETTRIYAEKIVLLKDDVFTHKELEALYAFSLDLECINSVDENEIALKWLASFHDYLCELCEHVEEVKKLVDTFGKTEPVSVYEFGTMKQKWVYED